MHKKQTLEKFQEVVKKVDKAIYEVIKLPDRERLRFATLISLSAQKHKIDPKIMIAILKVESDFKQRAVSNTGDFGVSQINYNVWVKEFVKINKRPLHLEQLKEDDAYAIMRMGEILEELKRRHEAEDKYWFARYHSNTKHFKDIYIEKLEKNLKKLEKHGDNLLKDLPDIQKFSL